MSMGKARLAVLFTLLIFLLQISHASALELKGAALEKGGTKKSKVKRKAQAATVSKTGASAAGRTRKSSVAVPRRAVKKNVKGKRQAVAVRNKSTAAPVRRAAVTRVKHAPRVSAVVPAFNAADLAGLNPAASALKLGSNVVYALDESNSQVLFEKNSEVPLPIASITKLMTALVVSEARQDMAEILQVTADDIDREKNTSSRLPVGAKLSRADMLHIALMSSENRAASALGRNFPGGLPAFVAAMNAKAQALGMTDTHYVEPTGLSSRNVASARDLAKLVIAAHEHPLLAQYSTNSKYEVDTGRRTLQYVNSNRLIGNEDWEIGLQKTGYISEAGRCLVMQVRIGDRPVVMVFLDSKGHLTRFADASRLREWVIDKFTVQSTIQVKLVEKRS